MKKKYFETVIGFIVIIVAIAFSLYFHKIYNKKTEEGYYRLYAIFSNVEGVNVYTKVKIGGLEVGEVENLNIDSNYRVILKLKIKKDLQIPIDSNLKISTSGIIGGKYLKLEIGNDEEIFENGGYFQFTESTMDLEDMITRFMMNKVSEDK
jgi:phospholipid/cholesterol/gamma-HCH transport system substrate-binding protein